MLTNTKDMKKGNVKNKIKIQPLYDRVLLEIPTREEKTKGGIIIPDTVDKEKPEQGKIIAVGEGRIAEDGKLIPMKVKVGDTVVFSKYGYDEITIDDTTYYMLKEESILAVIK